MNAYWSLNMYRFINNIYFLLYSLGFKGIGKSWSGYEQYRINQRRKKAPNCTFCIANKTFICIYTFNIDGEAKPRCLYRKNDNKKCPYLKELIKKDRF